eukprot:c5556_g1_i1.p1 GENE.c5556_g1_i1~~c5556_g1_i1.p1  ORF type:complete len:323 (-),score=90.50 c5556_g1_i1:504-1472(-)
MCVCVCVGVQVHAKVDNAVCITKAIFKVDTSPNEIFELLTDESRLSSLIPSLKQLTVIERTVGSISNPVKSLGNLTFDSAFDKVFTLTVSSDLGCDVDFCLLQSSLFNSEDCTCVVLFRSVTHVNMGTAMGSTMGTTMGSTMGLMGRLRPSGFLITPIANNGSLVSVALQADLDNAFPPLIHAIPTDQLCSLLSNGLVSVINQLETELLCHRNIHSSIVMTSNAMDSTKVLANSMDAATAVSMYAPQPSMLPDFQLVTPLPPIATSTHIPIVFNPSAKQLIAPVVMAPNADMTAMMAQQSFLQQMIGQGIGTLSLILSLFVC